jgi:hypothetical protein
MADLTRAREIHQRIIALCDRLTLQGYYFRKPAKATRIPDSLKKDDAVLVVDRDRIICALLNKLANTKVAIMGLAEGGHGDDAYALARVAIENSIIVAWLLQEDQAVRLDTYGLFTASHRARLKRPMRSMTGSPSR